MIKVAAPGDPIEQELLSLFAYSKQLGATKGKGGERKGEYAGKGKGRGKSESDLLGITFADYLDFVEGNGDNVAVQRISQQIMA